MGFGSNCMTISSRFGPPATRPPRKWSHKTTIFYCLKPKISYFLKRWWKLADSCRRNPEKIANFYAASPSPSVHFVVRLHFSILLRSYSERSDKRTGIVEYDRRNLPFSLACWRASIMKAGTVTRSDQNASQAKTSFRLVLSFDRAAYPPRAKRSGLLSYAMRTVQIWMVFSAPPVRSF